MYLYPYIKKTFVLNFYMEEMGMILVTFARHRLASSNFAGVTLTRDNSDTLSSMVLCISRRYQSILTRLDDMLT